MSTFINRLKSNQTGVVLIEALIALVVIGVVIAIILGSLGTGARATSIAKEQATAESLARSEIEYIKNHAFDVVYGIDPSLSVAEGWTIMLPIVQAVPGRDGNIQKITVTINHGTKTILSLTDYKVNR